MSLYSDYLDAKSELLSKDLAFKTAVNEWFQKHDTLLLMQQVDIVDSLTMDHFTITSTLEFQKYLNQFENEFEVKCVRIHHQEIITLDEMENIKHVWKYHFKEQRGE